MLFALAEDDPLVQDTQLDRSERPSRFGLDGRRERSHRFSHCCRFRSMRSRAVELVRLGPDVIVTHGTPPTKAVRRAAGSLPIVFVNVSDPIEAGFVGSWPQPGGNIPDYQFRTDHGRRGLTCSAKSRPRLRVAMLFNPSTANAVQRRRLSAVDRSGRARPAGWS